MLRARLIPCLLLRNGGLVKTKNFREPKYVGDPINAVRIYNEKEVDELLIVDIDATVKQKEPDYELIRSLAAECRMPLCYGGGLRTTEQIEKIIGLGVEKVAISSAAVLNPSIIMQAARRIGSQSVVVVLDVKKVGLFGRYEVVIKNGRDKTGIDPCEFSSKLADFGAGELLINSVDRDGCMGGYDLKLIEEIREHTRLPMTVVGGAGSLEDIKELVSHHGIIGAAAGSLFVFKGKYKAVLINYPTPKEKSYLLS